MFKKKQSLPFGRSIAPDCSYCCRNGGVQGAPVCALGRRPGPEGGCPKFRYDPLARRPRPAPSLRPGGWDPEDFKL